MEKELIENFQKARRVGRSPPQEATEGEGTESEGTEGEPKDIKMDKLDRLTELVLTVKKDTQDIKKENESINKEIRELKEEWKRKREAWEREKEEIQKRIKNLETKRDKADELIERINRIEQKEEARKKREKRNNITLKGEELPRGETPEDTAVKVISENLQVEVEIEDIFWTRKGERGSILIAKLRNWQQKKEIMIKKGKLKGKKIYIDNDLTKNERETQKAILGIAKAEREQGAHVKIGYRKVKINDRIFKWKEGVGLEETKFWSRQSSVTL